MNSNEKGFNTICTHYGELIDTQFKGAISPIYLSTSYAFDGVDEKRYPRYFNTPNQQALSKKIAKLEHAESGLIFGSGMAAISTSLFAFLQQGDHIILQRNLYGGTINLVIEEFKRFGIEHTFVDAKNGNGFEEYIKSNTKVIYIETPSNPLLTVTDIASVTKLAKKHGLMTMIDNTFASPVNQNPILLGVDIVIHSATKYLGGHSDILAGAVVSTEENMQRIFKMAINFGGSLSDFTVWMLERSIKTLGLRVRQQNENAMALAQWLSQHEDVAQVYYPGLESHPDHAVASQQMKAYGGMLSFELKENIDSSLFQKKLQLIKSSMSLAGVESTILSPTLTSHALLTEEERYHQGIRNGLLRFSLGIEEAEDLIEDIEQALRVVKNQQYSVPT
ncbi:PLP-dependent aspartate aminotransferase family protein [Aquimarina sp. ERC-38]|uniref:trans-sulfuration enzyme family protein n=1 Tax=Aquimarina sp. ERC-38 TaxID=2949996 RepID=UPI002245313E|nr:PLP-dependent aspartate aminotransferase family protein [Aquimarina sp. ERC-38]UZO80302.1 PLP-dependent aspartate aminotransferase family protein [Aquimarina sp. ERC-38]